MNSLDVVVLILAIAVGALYLALVLWAVVEVVRSPRLSLAGRILWVLVILVIPPFGSMLWYWLGDRLNVRVSRTGPGRN